MNAEQIYNNYRIPECIDVSQSAPVFNMFLLICLTANLLLLSFNLTSSNKAARCNIAVRNFRHEGRLTLKAFLLVSSHSYLFH